MISRNSRYHSLGNSLYGSSGQRVEANHDYRALLWKIADRLHAKLLLMTNTERTLDCGVDGFHHRSLFHGVRVNTDVVRVSVR